MAMKINKLEIENVKRVKAVKIAPAQNGLTIIGGNNGQGKTSVLDSIAWALGGNKFKPSTPMRDGSMIPPHLHIVMNNGLVVERKGKNSDLKVIDPEGNKAGQQLLDSFIEELALNLPKFMESSSKEKANILLQIIGVGEQLLQIEKEEQEVYNQRHALGVIADQKEKYAREQPFFPDVPQDLLSASDLIRQQQEILARNGENQRKRDRLQQILAKKKQVAQEMDLFTRQLEELKEKLGAKEKEYKNLLEDEKTANKTVSQLIDESTEQLEANIAEIDEINAKVRANLTKEKAEEDAADYRAQYEVLTKKLEDIRKKKSDLLVSANLPLEGLSVKDGELIYKGFQWDNMSGSDRLKVSTAIVRKLNPNCGFVLLDKLEQMDLPTLEEFGKWLEAEGLQAIATRVSTGGECSLIIEDGYVKEEASAPSSVNVDAPKWKF